MIQEVIAKEADRQGLSARALALKAGVPVRSVQRLFAGDNSARCELADRLMQVLGLTVQPTEQKRPKRKGGQ